MPSIGVPAGETVIVVVAWFVQGSDGVNNRLTGPSRPAGSKVLPLTPGPAQVPFGKAGSCRLIRLKGPSVSQMLALPSTGVCGLFTVIVAVAALVQAVLGVNNRLTGPESPSGLKVFPLTPGPDQVPLGKAGSCRTARLNSPSVSQSVASPRSGVPGTFTVIAVLAG